MYEIVVQEELQRSAIIVDSDTVTLIAYAIKDIAELFVESNKTELDSFILLPSNDRFFAIRLELEKHIVTSGLSISIAELELNEYLEMLSFGRDNNLPDIEEELKKDKNGNSGNL